MSAATSQVLAESEQMRKEADDIGPRAELDHWKKRTSKFNYHLDQIKGSEVKAVLGVLHAAKSKLIKVVWSIFSIRKFLHLNKHEVCVCPCEVEFVASC